MPDDGTIQAGAPLSYTDNGNGTITDNITGLMWERKDDSGGLHDKDNFYAWSGVGSQESIWDWLDDINAEGGWGLRGTMTGEFPTRGSWRASRTTVVLPRQLRLGETKAGRTHYVPFSPPALTLLQMLPRQEGNFYLLPSTKVPGHHLVNIKKPWRRVRKAAGVEDVRLHDLRRTVGSWLAQAGNSLPLIGRVLNTLEPLNHGNLRTARRRSSTASTSGACRENHGDCGGVVSGCAFSNGTPLA